MIPHDTFLVGYAGGFRSLGLEKGLHLMIDAVQYLDTNITIVLVGGKGPDIELYTRMAEKRGVANRCILVPRKQFEVLVEYEVAMDALVIPYPNKHHFREYGFPMKVWEYMATGKPIIYSNLDIIAEVLKERGVCFEPDSVSDLVRAITFVYTQKESLRDQALQNSYDVSEYSWDSRTNKVIEFIK
jgi:glycosyltransferase involved in cell wall biosynthesis